jgi:DNA-binding response OmpR family regulator
MGLDANSRERFNLTQTSVLLVDSTPLGMSILVQVLIGLGVKTLHRCATMDEAKQTTLELPIDLAIVDSLPPQGDGYEFVRWLRHETEEPNRYTPVVMTTSHTPRRQVSFARDCGANITIKKPFAPVTLLERIVWCSKEGRRFLFCDTYAGPDRRFQDLGPPEGVEGRRREDIENARTAAGGSSGP